MMKQWNVLLPVIGNSARLYTIEPKCTGLNELYRLGYTQGPFRGCTPFCLYIKLGCWLNNSFNHQKTD